MRERQEAQEVLRAVAWRWGRERSLWDRGLLTGGARDCWTASSLGCITNKSFSVVGFRAESSVPAIGATLALVPCGLPVLEWRARWESL